jgi:hypothetical protein
MGGDDSQKLCLGGESTSPPRRKPPAQLRNQHCNGNSSTFERMPTGMRLSYRLTGSFLEGTGGSVLARAEDQDAQGRKNQFCGAPPRRQ